MYPAMTDFRLKVNLFNKTAGLQTQPLGLQPNLSLTKHVDIDVDNRGVRGDS